MTDLVDSEVTARLLELQEEVAAHEGDRPHDHWARLAVAASIEAGLEGNACIGALLADPDGNVLLNERNRMFIPRFRSDFHAEMALLTRWEEENPSHPGLVGYTLVTSLEPCEMCNIRIITSGVTNVLYIAPDQGKGAITGPNDLAPQWAALAKSQNFAAADCDPRLAEISLDAFVTVLPGVTARLMARR